jgi:hypothetical protein
MAEGQWLFAKDKEPLGGSYVSSCLKPVMFLRAFGNSFFAGDENS